MVTLQQAGIAAGVARLPIDLPGDPHLLAIGHWQPVVRPFMGPHLLPSVSYREETPDCPTRSNGCRADARPAQRARCCAQLGLGDVEIDELRDSGVIGNVRPRRKRTRRQTG